MRHDNSHHLFAAGQRRRADTLERARKALQELGETGQRRTVTQIADPSPASPAHGSTPKPICVSSFANSPTNTGQAPRPSTTPSAARTPHLGND